MRILVLSQYFWPETFRINDLVVALVGRGHDVTVLTGVPNYPEGMVYSEYAADPEAYGNYGGARVLRMPMLARGKSGTSLVLNYASFAFSAALVGAWRLRRERFDVIFVFEPSPVTVGLPAVFLRALKGIPVVFWVLDQWPETLAAVGVVKSKAVLRAIGTLVSYIYRRCDLLLAQSRSMVPQVRKYCRVGQRVEHFPSWAEDASGGAGDVVPAPELPEPLGGFNVMFAGNIGESQDFPAVLAAAELLKDRGDIKWFVVGDGRAAAWVRQEIQRRGLQEHVVLLGRFPADRMPSFFCRADVLLVTLRKEPIFAATVPGKVQSYLAAGVPIVGMLDGEGSDIIKDSGAGLVCGAGDFEGLARAVTNIARLSPTVRADMGARGRNYYLENFERERLIARLERLMHQIAVLKPTASVAGEKP